MSMSDTVALIPARGGSKGVPRKNLRTLGGKPLIAWTIEAARRCSGIDRILVSTDDPEIQQVAKSCGAEAPFLRPLEFASDSATSVSVGLHALDWLAANGGQPRRLVQLQPTSPLRSPSDIDGALLRHEEMGVPAVVSVRPASHPPQWLRRLGPEGQLLPWSDSPLPARRQDVDTEVYELNGAIYVVDTDIFRSERSYFPAGTIGYVMPAERSLDIDTLWDFHLAELVVERRFTESQTDPKRS